MEDRLLLKTKGIPFWLEIGLFNIFILVLMLPPTWIQYLTEVCTAWSLCCCKTGEAFFRGNHFRLELLAITLPGLILAETALLRPLLSKDSPKNLMLWLDYAARNIFRSLPFLLLIISAMALPEYQPIYAAIAVLGIWTMFGASGLCVPLSPVSLIRNQGGTAPRQHLKYLMLYLTLIVVVVPALFFSRAYGCSCGSKVSSVKANMHTFQTIVETYAVDSGGLYAPTTQTLRHEAETPGREYWKDFTNPYSALSGSGNSYTDMPKDLGSRMAQPDIKAYMKDTYRDVMGIRIYNHEFIKLGIPARAGLVLYDYVSPTRYYIYGLDKKGEIIRDRGQAFTLTNS